METAEKQPTISLHHLTELEQELVALFIKSKSNPIETVREDINGILTDFFYPEEE